MQSPRRWCKERTVHEQYPEGVPSYIAATKRRQPLLGVRLVVGPWLRRVHRDDLGHSLEVRCFSRSQFSPKGILKGFNEPVSGVTDPALVGVGVLEEQCEGHVFVRDTVEDSQAGFQRSWGHGTGGMVRTTSPRLMVFSVPWCCYTLNERKTVLCFSIESRETGWAKVASA